MLQIQLQGRVASSHAAAFVRCTFELSAPSANGAIHALNRCGRWRFGEHVHTSTIGGVADVACIAWTALNQHATDDGGRKIRRGMVCRAVGVAKGNAIKSHVVFAVLEAAH